MRLIIFFLFVAMSLEANYCIQVLTSNASKKNLNLLMNEAKSNKYNGFDTIRVESRGNYLTFRLGEYKDYKETFKDIFLVQKFHKDAYVRKCELLKEKVLYMKNDRQIAKKAKHQVIVKKPIKVEIMPQEQNLLLDTNSRTVSTSQKIEKKNLKPIIVKKPIRVQKQNSSLDKNREAYHTLEKAYRADSKGEKAEAYKLFDEAASECNESSIYNKACRGVIMYHPLRQKYLDDPYYATIYGEAVWFERKYKPQTANQKDFEDAVYQIKARVGRYIDDRKKISVYLFTHLDGDTNSRYGEIPIIYSENYAGVGIGLDYRPINQARLFIETSIENNSIRDDGNDIENDYRIGAEYYDQWGPGIDLHCSYDTTVSFDWFSDLYLSAVAYSRYDNNIILQSSARLGARLLHYKMSTLSAYGRLGITADTHDDFFNNVADVGPGIEIQPYKPFPLSIRTEYRFSKYFKNVRSGDTDRYNTLLVYGIFYFEK